MIDYELEQDPFYQEMKQMEDKCTRELKESRARFE